GELLFTLFKNNKKEDFETSLNILKSLEPNKTKSFYPHYFKEIEDIILKALTLQGFPFEEILSFLERMSPPGFDSGEVETHRIGVILLYQSTLKVATENNDIKSVTAITYSLDTYVGSIGSSIKFVKQNDNNLQCSIEKMHSSLVDAIKGYERANFIDI